MPNLLKMLNENDLKTIDAYVNAYGGTVKGEFMGAERWLGHWAIAKKNLYKLFGNKLIMKKHIKVEKDSTLLKYQINNLFDEEINYDCIIRDIDAFETKYNFYKINVEELRVKFDANTCYHVSNLRSFFYHYIMQLDYFPNGICTFDLKLTLPKEIFKEKRKCTLTINKGMPFYKAIAAIVNFIEPSKESIETLERIRVALSTIFTDKIIDADLYFSIHPMDFITASDNAENWRSCMNWIDDGCYRIGTVEMMNSDNVICCYILNNNHIIEFGNGYSWNSKSWRQFTVIDKDIICSGKGYPYISDKLSEVIVQILKELQSNKDEFNEIAEYKDFEEADVYYDCHEGLRNDNNSIWINGEKYNAILFETNGMYNDFYYNTHNAGMYATRIKKNDYCAEWHNISGHATCLCCGNSALTCNPVFEDCDYDNPDLDVSDAYINTDRLLCSTCYSKFECECCHNRSNNLTKIMIYNAKKPREIKVCDKCFMKNGVTGIKACPCCGKAILPQTRDFILVPKDVKLSYSTCYQFANGICCYNCYHRMIKQGKIKKVKVVQKIKRKNSWRVRNGEYRSREYFVYCHDDFKKFIHLKPYQIN